MSKNGPVDDTFRGGHGTLREAKCVMTNRNTKQAARAHQAEHGTSYTEALRQVLPDKSRIKLGKLIHYHGFDVDDDLFWNPFASNRLSVLDVCGSAGSGKTCFTRYLVNHNLADRRVLLLTSRIGIHNPDYDHVGTFDELEEVTAAARSGDVVIYDDPEASNDPDSIRKIAFDLCHRLQDTGVLLIQVLHRTEWIPNVGRVFPETEYVRVTIGDHGLDCQIQKNGHVEVDFAPDNSIENHDAVVRTAASIGMHPRSMVKTQTRADSPWSGQPVESKILDAIRTARRQPLR